MEILTGKVEKVYIPDNGIDIMYSKNIGFIIDVKGVKYQIEAEQNFENASIMRDDIVDIMIQIIDNHKFIDVRKHDGELDE